LAEILLEAVEEILAEVIAGRREVCRGPAYRPRGHLKVAATGAELAAAYELDYFESVAGGYAGLFPFGFRQDFQIVFDGDAAGVQPEMVEKGAHIGAGGQLFGFSVYVNVNRFGHDPIILQEREVSHATKSGGRRWRFSHRRELRGRVPRL
jgi:hypothetical protein